jgi:hypothetical protein
MVTMKRARVWRTATVTQFKDIIAPEGSSDEDIEDAAEGVPWVTAKVHETDDYIIERDE